MTSSVRASSSSRPARALLDHALGYARAGWAVFPVKPRGKHPICRHGVKDATIDQDVICAWWSRSPGANIGLAIPPGFLVVDIDSRDALEKLRGDRLPKTARATTGRGIHLWYSVANAEVRNAVGFLPGVDIKARGGYVVAPPSIHPSGAVYRWQVGLDPRWVTPCPGWILDRIASPSSKPSPSRSGHSRSGRSTADWHRTIAGTIPEGQRNQTLARVAGLLFRRLPAEIASELAYCWARVKMSPPLPEREVLRTIDSIAGLELRREGGRWAR